LVSGAFLGSALSAQAATVVGSSLAASDGNTSESCSNGECTQWNDALPGATIVAPAGVVTKFTVRSAVAIQARIRVVRGASASKTVVDSSPYSAITGTDVAHDVDTRLTVEAGDILALGLPPANDTPFASNGSATTRCFTNFQPNPADGATEATIACGSGRELLYNATVEADADADGYGDETQDACPTVSGPGACPVDPPADTPATAPVTPPAATPDKKAPVISSLSLLNSVFSVDNDVAALTDTPRGTAFRYTLSEAGTVTITIEQRAAGRRVGARCRKQTADNRKRRRCVRFVLMRTVVRAAAAGDNSVAFGGRIRVGNGSRLLPAGRYRALVEAKDAAGNVSAERQVTFRVVR
jgi:hypothetical protein